MSKFKSRNGTPEVHSARSKLDGLLQTLVTKKEESPPEPGYGGEEEEEDAMHSLTTPTKKSKSRKRKRPKEEILTVPETVQYHHTYVMKLFDRSVDLAQFEEDSSLYPICRAWMRNQPHNRNLAPRERSPTPEPENPVSLEDEDDVYNLPSPITVKKELGEEYRDPRIPELEPQPDGGLNIHADPDSAPAPEQILLNHMQRWKRVRQRWKDSGFNRERQYSASLEILRSMYDRQYNQ